MSEVFQRPSQRPSQSAIFLSELRVVLPLIVLPLKTRVIFDLFSTLFRPFSIPGPKRPWEPFLDFLGISGPKASCKRLRRLQIRTYILASHHIQGLPLTVTGCERSRTYLFQAPKKHINIKKWGPKIGPETPPPRPP